MLVVLVLVLILAWLLVVAAIEGLRFEDLRVYFFRTKPAQRARLGF